MIRVLQLLSRGSDFQTTRSIAQLLAKAGSEFHFTRVEIGQSSDVFGVAAAAIRLRRQSSHFDLIHAWGGAALAAAAATAVNVPIIFSPGPTITPRAIRWLRALLDHRKLHVACATATQRRLLVENGVPLANCQLIRPGVDFSTVRRPLDAALRKRFGFGEKDVVVLAPGESTRAAAHRDAMWAVGLLNVLDPRYRILVLGDGQQTPALKRFAANLHQSDILYVAAERLPGITFEELTAAADVAIVAACGPIATLPVVQCMAAGLPIVATVTHTVAELLEDRHTALMPSRPTPRALAQRLIDVLDDSQLRWSIRDMARTEAYEYFAATRFVSQFREFYRQVAGGLPVWISEPSPGGGARFHGLAK